MNQSAPSFLRSVLETIKAIFTDRGAFMVMILAPMFYGVYYPWPYSTQIVRNLPVAIVDNSNDSLSRKIIQFVSASPALKIHVVADEQTAKSQLIHSEIMAMMVIPPKLRRDVIKGKKVSVNMIGHGAYFLASKNAQQAMASAIGTVSAGVEIKRLTLLGLGKDTISAIRSPVPLIIDPINNQNEGYGSYVVPAVAWLILQQTLFIGCAMLVSTWVEQKRVNARPSVWLARIVGISLIHSLICLGYTGALFSFWGYQAGGNPYGNLLLIAVFSPSVATLGCLIGLLVKDQERSMQLLVFTALPMFFISGYSWPTEQLPQPLQWLSWAIPSTSAIHAGINLNQLGSSVFENRIYFQALTTITCLSLPLLMWLGRVRNEINSPETTESTTPN